MASESVQTGTGANVKVPRPMLTGPNCIVVTVGNDYSRGRHSFKAGDLVLVDLDAVPKFDSFVMVFSEPQPFGRICYIPPTAQATREDMVMGVLDADGGAVHMIHLGKGGRQFGVAVAMLSLDGLWRKIDVESASHVDDAPEDGPGAATRRAAA